MSLTTLEHKTRRIAVAAAAVLLLGSGATVAGDGHEAAPVVDQQISANEARRVAYRYLSDQGYGRRIGPGSARVRDITRDGDTWILTVAFSNGTNVQSGRTMLYIDARTALVSELPPTKRSDTVAAQ